MKPQPTLKQLHYLTAVAEHGHFGRAAEASFVTQSTLSAGIKELETVLGAVLIERTKRTVTITPLGEEVVARARAILRETEDLVDLVAASREPLSGELRLGVIPTIGPYLIPRVLPALRKAYPDLKLYLREDQTARLLDRLANGDLDVVLMALPYRADGMTTLIVGDDPFYVAVPKGHAFAARKSVGPEALEGEHLLLLEDGHCLRDHALGACRIAAADSDTDDFEATSLQTLVQMVEGGLGLTLLPKIAIDGGVLKGTHLVTRPLTGPDTARRIGLVWRRTTSRGREFGLLGDLLRAALADA